MTAPTWSCEDHDAHDPSCRKCTQRRPIKAKAALDAARFEDLCLHIQNVASQLSERYADLVEPSLERQVGAQQGGSNADGSERDVAALLISVERSRDRLVAVTESTENAYSSLRAAMNGIVRAEDDLDDAHPLTPDRAERQRERPADRRALIESYRAKARALTDGAASYDRRASQIERQMARERRQRATAAARLAGQLQSKGQRKRARNQWQIDGDQATHS